MFIIYPDVLRNQERENHTRFGRWGELGPGPTDETLVANVTLEQVSLSPGGTQGEIWAYNMFNDGSWGNL